jgi:putative glycosyltransferase (TIGR04372 family)
MKTPKEVAWENLNYEKFYLENYSFYKIIFFILNLFFFLISSFFRLRIGLLNFQKIGQTLGNLEYYLRSKKYHKLKDKNLLSNLYFDIFIFDNSFNSQIYKMYKRRMFIIKNKIILKFLNYLKTQTRHNKIWIDTLNTGWLRGRSWSSISSQVNFTANEVSQGNKILENIGIIKGSQYVCIFAKDQNYKDNVDKKNIISSFWKKNDFRNCNINNYEHAVKYLTSKKIYVIRFALHEKVEKIKFRTNKYFIDYALDIRKKINDKDFADVYIAANCKFFLGCTSSVYLLSSIFNVPIAYTNLIPYGECGRKNTDLFIYKKIKYLKNKKFLSISEVLNEGLKLDWINEKKLKMYYNYLKFFENTKSEIKFLAIEMNKKIDKNWILKKDEKYLKNKFANLLNIKCFDESAFPSKVGYFFIKKNKYLLK